MWIYILSGEEVRVSGGGSTLRKCYVVGNDFLTPMVSPEDEVSVCLLKFNSYLLGSR